MNTIFFELKNLLESYYFPKSNLIHSTTNDGRLESAESESVVIDFLKTNSNNIFKIIEAPKPRYWYDIIIEYKNYKFYTNVKLTDGIGADNVSSKKGMFYSLTNILPETITGLDQWIPFNEKLISNFNPNAESDYYFLVYFKQEEKFLFTSLKQIDVLVPNGNNLPFQCKWSNNIIPTTRSITEQSYYIMNIFIESFVRKANGLNILLDWREKNNES